MDSTTDDQHPAPKRDVKPATSKVSQVVDFDEKTYDRGKIKGDIQHGVAHPMNELEEHVNDLDDSWETESLLAEMLEGLTDDNRQNGK